MLKALLRAMRPKQWIKNGFVLAGLVFDGRFFELPRLLNSLATLLLFCMLSSAVYLMNDLTDIEKDRQHPSKRFRPIASGELKPNVAVLAALILVAGALAIGFSINNAVGLIALGYGLLMLSYSCFIKQLVILDVMTIAAGFVLRVFAGASAVRVTRFSPWLYVCTTLLALFIALNKRRHEILLLSEEANNHRPILEHYSLAFLDNMTSIVTASALAAYSFYTFSAPNLPENHTMMFTIPFVMYGIFRYLYLIHIKTEGGAPEELVLRDKPLLIAVLLWALTAGLVIYWPR